MNEKEIAHVFLVRSVEETTPESFSPGILAEAMDTMGDGPSKETLIAKRASYLFSQLPETLQKIPHITQMPLKWMVVPAFAALFLGLSSNFLGPNDRFHIIYNPIIILIAWNILVFSLLLVSKIGRLTMSPKALPLKSPHSQERPCDHHADDAARQSPGEIQLPRIPLRYRLLTSLWLYGNQVIGRLQARKNRLTTDSKIVYTFWDYYVKACAPILSARVRSVIHIFAIGLIIGALSGTYVRGIFTEYSVVWRSSFINDPHAIRVTLDIVLGIPTYIVSGHFVDAKSVTQLTSAAGAHAAYWIHILAVASLLFILVPRSLLLLLDARAIRRRSASLKLNVADPYFAAVIKKRREAKIKSLRDRLEPLVSAEISKFSESVAVYVRDRLFNRIIVPKFTEFRDCGGRIADLERDIEAACKEFGNELDGYITAVQNDCQTSLSNHVTRLIGREVTPAEMSIDYAGFKQENLPTHSVGDDVANGIGDAISTVVTVAVACSVATISGGFGKALGVALIASILHTTGPVGWVIGAVIGLLAAGGVSWLAKDRLTDAIKEQTIPAILTKTILSDERLAKKLEEGRQKVYTDIKREVEKNLAPSVPAVAEKILDGVLEGLRA